MESSPKGGEKRTSVHWLCTFLQPLSGQGSPHRVLNLDVQVTYDECHSANHRHLALRPRAGRQRDLPRSCGEVPTGDTCMKSFAAAVAEIEEGEKMRRRLQKCLLLTPSTATAFVSFREPGEPEFLGQRPTRSWHKES